MGIGDFIGTFKDHKGVPEKFQKIKNGSTKSKNCYFRLHAEQDEKKEIGPSEYYGLRENKASRKIGTFTPFLLNNQTSNIANKRAESFWDRFVEHCEDKFDLYKGEAKGAWKDFENVLKSEGCTVDWQEYIGIDKKDTWQKTGGCDFRVEVTTELSQAPKVSIPALLLLD